MRNLVFFYPKIEDDGLKKTLITYLKFFADKYNIILITNSFNLKIPKKELGKIKIDNLENIFFKKIIFFNNFLCFLKIFKYLNEKSIIFSLDKHLYPLLLKFFKVKFKLILRIPNPIVTEINLKNSFFSNYAGNLIGNFDLNLLRYADKVVVYSKKNLVFLKKKYNLDNLVLIRNFFEKKRVNKRKTKKNYNIFFIGRLEANKDPIFFVKSLIKIKNHNFKLNIVGEGSEKIKLLNLKNSYKNVKVKLFGYVNNPFKKFHKIIDLFCLTSKFDGTPNVLGEAISYKIPCIAPKSVGSANELLGNGKFGNLYLPRNEKSFRNSVTKTLTNYQSYIRKAEKAYINLNLYSKKNTLEKLDKTIIKLLE